MKIAVLAVEGRSTNIVCNALAKEFSDVSLILEEPVSKVHLLKRRLKNLGIVEVAGQVLFLLIVDRLLRGSAEGRIKEILRDSRLDDLPVKCEVRQVSSVNSAECRELLQTLQPDLVVINGTRIISKETLQTITVPFVNMHAGITPAYRGVHGGYWALAEGHPELAGTTIHFVDSGIDTGQVIRQGVFTAGEGDSFATYPFHQLGVGIPLMLEALKEISQGSLVTRPSISKLPSRLHYHPTIWKYLANRLTRGIR